MVAFCRQISHSALVKQKFINLTYNQIKKNLKNEQKISKCKNMSMA